MKNGTVKKLQDKAKARALKFKLGSCKRFSDASGPEQVKPREGLTLAGKCAALDAAKLKAARPFGWRRYV